MLHVLRYPREDLDAVVARRSTPPAIGLTFGVHSRIDETIERATARSAAGNQYVNRNVIGAVVGVQPFGGHGLSGTGPKAGGPLYVRRLLSQRAAAVRSTGCAASCRVRSASATPTACGPRARSSASRAIRRSVQPSIEAAQATGNRVTEDPDGPHLVAALFAGSPEDLLALNQRLAAREGPIVPVSSRPIRVEFLVDEVSLSVNTAAAGGNASLMTIGLGPVLSCDSDRGPPAGLMVHERADARGPNKVTDTRSLPVASTCRSRRPRARGTASGVLARASLPMSRRRLCSSGTATATFTASESRVAISAGRPAGAARPSHDTTS